MQELANGVYAVPQEFSRGDHTITIYPAAVETDDGVLLVDVGFPGKADAIDAQLGEAGLGLDDVEAVVCTHQDGDHVAGLSEIVGRSGATVYAHREAAPFVDGREEPIKGEGERYPPVPVDVELVDGVVFRTAAGGMRVVFTPGHAPGHVALYLPDERLLIAADALTAGDGLAGPSEQFTLEMDEAADSVARLADLDVDRTLCHHGGFVEEGSERIAEIRASMTG